MPFTALGWLAAGRDAVRTMFDLPGASTNFLLLKLGELLTEEGHSPRAEFNPCAGAEDLAVVIGASGGIGRAAVDDMTRRGWFRRVIALSRPDLDLTDETSIARAAAQVADAGTPGLILQPIHGGVVPETDRFGYNTRWEASPSNGLVTSEAINVSANGVGHGW